ncbi:MAG: hypothetical protein COA96_03030 [SAR86 cluster bacterium]|uniref:Uncharacterized protein n=1 Tax=SAR86 cluster bacterium TaxID=2030880 RepID=A0A2A5B7D3_9GAMM|nr:MAG: hypothetical protein COA96_03030 [SAR86 cluster bacterium]
MHQSNSESKLSMFNPLRLRRMSFGGIALGILALLTCELPIILALVGFGGLSAGAAWLKPPPIVELIGALLLITGIVLLVVLVIKSQLMKPSKAK